MSSIESRLPTGWVWSTLGDLCEPSQYGWTTKAVTVGEVKFLRTTDITHGPIDWRTVPYCAEPPPELARYQLSSGDIVVSRAGSVGFSALIDAAPEHAVFASYLIRFRPLDIRMAKYLALYLQTPDYWRAIGAEAVGIALANVNARKLSAIPVPLPPRAEQDRIVEALEGHLAAVERGMRDMQSAHGRLDTLLVALLRNELSAGEDHALGAVAEISSGVTKGRKTKDEVAAHPFLRAANIRDGHLDLTEVKTIEASQREVSKYRLEAGDVLLVEGSGSADRLGQGWLWEGQVAECIHQNHVFRARPDRSVVLPRFLAWTLRSPRSKAYFRSVAKTTSGLSTMNRRQLAGIPIPLPPLDEQGRIARRLDQAEEGIRQARGDLERQATRSEELRRSLMHRALAGQLMPQISSDEPASELLARIKAERSERDAERRGKRPNRRSKQQKTPDLVRMEG